MIHIYENATAHTWLKDKGKKLKQGHGMRETETERQKGDRRPWSLHKSGILEGYMKP